MERYGWSLYEIDRTDIESLLAFVLVKDKDRPAASKRLVACDQVSWL